jgi:hypothetical protein
MSHSQPKSQNRLNVFNALPQTGANLPIRMPHNVGIERSSPKKMATEKQIAANRANASKSSGPKSAIGKAKVSRNSTRHHLLAKSFLLKSECSARFKAFVESFYAEYNPITPTETALVDTMATARWRLIRMSNLEASIIDHEYVLDADSADLTTPTRATLSPTAAPAIRAVPSS